MYKNNRSGVNLHIYSTPTKMKLGALLFSLFVIVEGDGDKYFADLDAENAALEKKDFIAYAALHGMNLSYHEVVTPEGWILQLWNVRNMEIYDRELSAPVILCHGFGGTAFDYLWNIRNESAAFIFAENGFDVWIPNWRGNHFSNRIQADGGRRKPTATEYYHVAWQYMASSDLPSVLDYVLSETNQEKVYLVGHSMGGTIPFAFLSGNHTYDDKISHYAALAPVMRFGLDTPFPFIAFVLAGAPVIRLVPEFLFRQLFGVQQFAYPDESFSALVTYYVCKVTPICRLINDVTLGRDMRKLVYTDAHMNKSRLQVYLAEEVGGFALMTPLNFIAEKFKDLWTKLDFDSNAPQTGLTNQEEYNSKEPPKYNFPAIKVPFSMFYVKKDNFNGPKSIQGVIDLLQAKDVKIIEGNELSHIDIVLGTDARCYIYNDILSKFTKLENDRDEAHKSFRSKVEDHLKELPFEDGCVGKTD